MEKEFKYNGMTCAACARAIESIGQNGGNGQASVNLTESLPWNTTTVIDLVESKKRYKR